MPTLFVFLFKVNIALLLFCGGYYLVLRHLTFYTLNRAYLVTAIIFATVYPGIDLTGFAQKHAELTRPVQNVALVWQAPAQKLAGQAAYWQWAEYIFWAGAALLAVRLAVQLFSLLKLYRSSKPANIHNHDVRIMDGDAAPFSFWQSIYVNPANHTPADLKAILLHEQVHVNGWHTIDILLAELSSIFYWFNPGIWLMKKAVRENIEFITDRKILNNGFDSKAYQYSLVNVSFNSNTPGIVNHFNISTIKKRIIMMNAKRSSKVNLTRYVLVIPSVVALLLVVTLAKAGVAKPIKLTISNAIYPVTVAIKEAAVSAINNTNSAIAQTKATALSMVKDTVLKRTLTFTVNKIRGTGLKTDSAHFSFTANKLDTGKKSTIYIRTVDGKNGIDSVNVVLNGKKISSGDFKNIDPNKILSVNIVSQDAVDGLIGPDNNLEFDNNRHVLFVTTKDSEAGKNMAEKLRGRSTVNAVRINGVNRNPATFTTSETAVIAALPGLTGTVNGKKFTTTRSVKTVNGKVAGIQAYSDAGPVDEIVVRDLPAKLKLNDIVVSGGPAKLKLNDVVVKGYGNKLYTSDSATTVHGYGTERLTITNHRAYVDEPAKTIVVRGYKSDNAGLARTMNPNKVISIETIDRASGAVVTPVNMADKLYIIDGKEASEKAMKKLSAFDIDRINVSKDNNMVEQYGDKAKNGVIFIYTKKNKK
ncbi:M56 family metallopeptidase [Mucilaginibacter sp.]|uniref:M56 family metallopeptidase n=1 Tax=Mucilaginibacter sp. TaxID=1882438 RepID=UPI0035BC8456